MHTCNLIYQGEPGALNEHFADVFGALVMQWHLKQDVKRANWAIGAEIMGPGTKAVGIRTFKADKAFQNDPCFGTDPQPKHMKDIYTGPSDHGGVHINSGIPNHAFYLVAMELGGNAWLKPGAIWYRTILGLNRFSVFTDMADMTCQSATSLYGAGSVELKAVKKAWKAVGL
jgi:Zn-dependent metalloprotease